MSPLGFRCTTAAVVCVFLGVTHAAFPDAIERSTAQYRFVIALGYGHLLGAALGGWRPRTLGLGTAFAGVTVAALFALYVPAVAAWPGLAFVLLALSVWHFTENDVALARALGSGGALGPLPRDKKTHALAVGVAAVVVGGALAVAPDAGLLGDLFSAATLFHLVGWLVFLLARGASRLRLLVLHAPPLALCGVLLAAPAEAAPLREWAFSPPIYLFWASLHVVHTLLARQRALA